MNIARLANPKYFPHATADVPRGVRGFLTFRVAGRRRPAIQCSNGVISFAIVPVFNHPIRLSPFASFRSVPCFLLTLVSLLCGPPRSRADVAEDAVRSLAHKVLATPTHDRRLFLSWENHSSLTAESSLKLRAIFADELGSDALAPSPSSNIPVLHVTIEETPAQIVLTARVLATADEPIHVSSFYRGSLPPDTSAGTKIRLQKELIWQQPEPIVDAIEYQYEANKEKALLILNTESLTLYRGDRNHWELSDSKRLPMPEKPSRDRRGEILLKENGMQVLLPGRVCDLKLADRIEMNCQDRSERLRQAVVLATVCTQGTFLLRSDLRDRSLPDRIFLQNPSSGKVDVPTAELEVSGPVLSLFPGESPFAAGAVVFNLSSGVYEIYRISAVCN